MTDNGSLTNRDGFHVAIDPAPERVDLILSWPPINVIAVPHRDQIRRVFEALDMIERLRVIVLRAFACRPRTVEKHPTTPRTPASPSPLSLQAIGADACAKLTMSAKASGLPMKSGSQHSAIGQATSAQGIADLAQQDAAMLII